MRKTILLIMSLLLALGLGASGAWGDVVTCPDNNVLPPPNGGQANFVQVWSAGFALAGGTIWEDVVGAHNPFATSRATYDTASHILTIFTNWGENTTSTVNTVPPITFVTADLFLNFGNGGATWDAAIPLSGADKGKVFYDPTFDTSIAVVGARVVNFGGKYTTNINGAGTAGNIFDIPVTVTSAASADTASVIWNSIVDPDALFSVAIDLSNVDNGFNPNNFTFLWGTSTCGNDVITCTPIPLPPSLLLLGSGLLGLGVMRFRRKSV
jgi:YD repeat-containing protein